MCFLRGVPKSTPKRFFPTPPTLRSQAEDTGDGELVEEGVLEYS